MVFKAEISKERRRAEREKFIKIVEATGTPY